MKKLVGITLVAALLLGGLSFISKKQYDPGTGGLKKVAYDPGAGGLFVKEDVAYDPGTGGLKVARKDPGTGGL